jgi:hypothetical protein
MPSTGNNDRCDSLYGSVEGLCYGIMPSEHASVDTIRAIYTIIGIEGYSGNGIQMPHAARIKYASVEGSGQACGFQSGTVNLDIDTLDAETVTNQIYDPNNLGIGTVGSRTGPNPTYNTGGINGAAGMRMWTLDAITGPLSAPQAAPGNGVAWGNGYRYNLQIAFTAATSLTGITITGNNGVTKALAIPAGATTCIFTLPAMSSYTPTYTGAGSHTVTQL